MYVCIQMGGYCGYKFYIFCLHKGSNMTAIAIIIRPLANLSDWGNHI